jgi:hypothetical protein
MTNIPSDVPAEIPTAPAAGALTGQPRPDTPAAGARRIRADQNADETPAEYWARKTAFAIQFIAWIIGLATAAAVILGIIAAVQLAHLNSNLYGGGGGSTCISQGGTNPNC